jgi:hypothetical protein
VSEDPSQSPQTLDELMRLRADREQLLRIIEAQSATAQLLAAKPGSSAKVWWFLMSLSLLLVLVLLLVGWFYFYQLEPVGEEAGSGTCAEWSLDASRRPERIAGGIGSGVPTYAPLLM